MSNMSNMLELFDKQFESWLKSGTTTHFENPTGNMRQDTWWKVSAMTNVLILKELKEIRKLLAEK